MTTSKLNVHDQSFRNLIMNSNYIIIIDITKNTAKSIDCTMQNFVGGKLTSGNIGVLRTELLEGILYCAA